MSGVDNEILSLDNQALMAEGRRCSILHLRSLDEETMPHCCDGYHIHDPSLGRSPQPRLDGERAVPPLKHPIMVGVAGVGCWGLVCGVSFGDSVRVVRGVARGVTPGIC